MKRGGGGERTILVRATTRSARAISRNQDLIQNTFELRSIHTAENKEPEAKASGDYVFAGKRRDSKGGRRMNYAQRA